MLTLKVIKDRRYQDKLDARLFCYETGDYSENLVSDFFNTEAFRCSWEIECSDCIISMVGLTVLAKYNFLLKSPFPFIFCYCSCPHSSQDIVS